MLAQHFKELFFFSTAHCLYMQKFQAPRGNNTIVKLFVIQIWGEIRKKSEGRCFSSHMSQNNAKEWREIPDSPPQHPLTKGLVIRCSEWKG